MKASIVHIYIIQKLISECKDFSDIIPKDDVSKYIYLTRIPQKETRRIIKELKELKFIDVIDRQKIKINKKEFEKYTSYF